MAAGRRERGSWAPAGREPERRIHAAIAPARLRVLWSILKYNTPPRKRLGPTAPLEGALKGLKTRYTRICYVFAMDGKVMVIGGTGLVGNALLRTWTERGAEVAAATYHCHPSGGFLQLDMQEEAKVRTF